VEEGEVHDLDGPASLFRSTDDIRSPSTIQLHRGEQTESNDLLFRTFGESGSPEVGGAYTVQWWWIPGTQRMLLGVSAWRLATVTEHTFCPLTYDNLDEGSTAYTDDRGNWISVAGWTTYVRDDLLRLRSG
jgi:hypothetical protein